MMLSLALLPETWFAAQPQWALLLIAAAAIAGLIFGADWLVEGASGAAARLGMPKVVIGATIIALGTTSPEAAVSVLAAWTGNAGVALGNGVGSILADSALIFGIGCLLAPLPADRFLLSRQGWVQIGAGVILALMCYGAFAVHGGGARLGRWAGALLVVLLGLYLFASVRWSRNHPEASDPAPNEDPPDTIADPPPELPPIAGAAGAVPLTPQPMKQEAPNLLTLAWLSAAGLALVVLAGDALVASVSELARRWGVPETVIAATLVAFGTSLPELIVGITAVRKNHHALLVGNIIGADVLNVFFVIGLSALARPLPITEPGTQRPLIFLQLHLPAMLVVLVMLRCYITRAVRVGVFSRWMGAPLVMLYAAYVILQYVLSI